MFYEMAAPGECTEVLEISTSSLRRRLTQIYRFPIVILLEMTAPE